MSFSDGRFELRTRGSENKTANERTPPFCNLAASTEEEPRPKLSRNLVHFPWGCLFTLCLCLKEKG